MSVEVSTTPPNLSAQDYAHAIVKGAISSAPIPIVGGIAAEVLSLIIVPPISKRQEEWITSIAQGLVALQEKVEGYRLDKLNENELFVSTLIHATQTAIQSHQKEKRIALRNAVLNSSLPDPPNDDYQQMFIRLIEFFTPLHLKVLNYLNHNDEIRHDRAKTTEAKIAKKFGLEYFQNHEFDEEDDFMRLVFQDFYNYRLTKTEPSKTTIFSEFINTEISPLGKKFINYITHPDLLKK